MEPFMAARVCHEVMGLEARVSRNVPTWRKLPKKRKA